MNFKRFNLAVRAVRINRTLRFVVYRADGNRKRNPSVACTERSTRKYVNVEKNVQISHSVHMAQRAVSSLFFLSFSLSLSLARSLSLSLALSLSLDKLRSSPAPDASRTNGDREFDLVCALPIFNARAACHSAAADITVVDRFRRGVGALTRRCRRGISQPMTNVRIESIMRKERMGEYWYSNVSPFFFLFSSFSFLSFSLRKRIRPPPSNCPSLAEDAVRAQRDSHA